MGKLCDKILQRWSVLLFRKAHKLRKYKVKKVDEVKKVKQEEKKDGNIRN